MKALFLSALLMYTSAAVSPVSAHNTPNQASAFITADDKELQQYAGTYTFTENGTFQKLTITVEKGELYGQVDSNESYKLVKQSEPDSYKSTSTYGSVYTFTRDPNTKAVTGFRMKIMDYNLEGKKDKQ
ncbi:hypothetical protein GCM10023189_51880 [Nibrella saemangeumensis]|uniref:Peptidase S12 Pab87-related C-terminal domain-containing protein n=1 Tax=Nibrella saemangeumensis TaxID=1084526 RepID=A0ABP8NLB4_9BACT